MDGWMDGWVDGWMDGGRNFYFFEYFYIDLIEIL